MASHLPRLVNIPKTAQSNPTHKSRVGSVSESEKTQHQSISADNRISHTTNPLHAIAEAIDAESIDESDVSYLSSFNDSPRSTNDSPKSTKDSPRSTEVNVGDMSHINRILYPRLNSVYEELDKLRQKYEQLKDDHAELKEKHARHKKNSEFFPVHDPDLPEPGSKEYKNMRQQLIEARAEVAELNDHNKELLEEVIKLDKHKVDSDAELMKMGRTIQHLSAARKAIMGQNEQLLKDNADLRDYHNQDLAPKMETKDSQIAELEKQLQTTSTVADKQLREKDMQIIALNEQIKLFTAAGLEHSEDLDSMLSSIEDPVEAATKLFTRMSGSQLITAYNSIHDCRLRLIHRVPDQNGASGGAAVSGSEQLQSPRHQNGHRVR